MKVLRNSSRFLVMIICISCFSSCKKKYEEGPRISLKSKAKRLEGKWIATYQRENGFEFLNDHTITFEFSGTIKKPSGDYFIYTLYHSDNSGAEVTREGTWSLGGNNENLYLNNDYYTYDPNDGNDREYGEWNYAVTYEIKRLTNKELWIESNSSTYSLRLEFEKEK